MTHTQYLYNMSRSELDQKIYEAITEVLLIKTINGAEIAQRIAQAIYDTRIKILKKYYKEILAVNFKDRKGKLEVDVYNAISFWQRLKTI